MLQYLRETSVEKCFGRVVILCSLGRLEEMNMRRELGGCGSLSTRQLLINSASILVIPHVKWISHCNFVGFEIVAERAT